MYVCMYVCTYVRMYACLYVCIRRAAEGDDPALRAPRRVAAHHRRQHPTVHYYIILNFVHNFCVILDFIHEMLDAPVSDRAHTSSNAM